MRPGVGRAPKNLDEQIVGIFELNDRCVVGNPVIPPPDNCSSYVQTFYRVSQWHLLTGLIVFIFVVVLIQLTFKSLKT